MIIYWVMDAFLLNFRYSGKTIGRIPVGHAQGENQLVTMSLCWDGQVPAAAVALLNARGNPLTLGIPVHHHSY